MNRLDATDAPSCRKLLLSAILSFHFSYLKRKLKHFWQLIVNKFLTFLFFLFGLVAFDKIQIFSTKTSHDAQRQPQNLLSTSTTLSKQCFENCNQDVNVTMSQDHLPSRWYTVLALPFPDQKLARRDISTFGRHGFYQSRAGFFSEPSPPL